MPCRCDEYSVTVSADHLESLEKKVEHLEGQLCAARSVVHKLLRFIDQQQRLAPGLLVELRDRAQEHVAALLAHKRAEANSDAAKAIKQAYQIAGQIAASEGALQAEVNARKNQIELLRKQHDDALMVAAKHPKFTDEELLG